MQTEGKAPTHPSTKGNTASLKCEISVKAPSIKLHLIRFSYNKSINMYIIIRTHYDLTYR